MFTFIFKKAIFSKFAVCSAFLYTFCQLGSFFLYAYKSNWMNDLQMIRKRRAWPHFGNSRAPRLNWLSEKGEWLVRLKRWSNGLLGFG